MFTVQRLAVLTDIIFTFIEGIIGLRILLRFLGANPSAPFVSWIYQTSRPLLSPFEGMFPSPSARGGFVIEVSALFAILIYAFVGYIIASVIAQLTNQHRNS